MHRSAFEQAREFASKYLAHLPPGRVLDVGSCDVNGTLRPIFEGIGWSYVGLDRQAGPNVDVVAGGGDWPIAPASFGAAVSSSCLEHDPGIFATFAAMARVVAPGGLIYCQAPSAGPEHRYPVDCWRILPDGWRALAAACPTPVAVLEAFAARGTDTWTDSIGIFRREG